MLFSYHSFYNITHSEDYVVDDEEEKESEQAGAELGQAQLKLELEFTSTNLHQINEQESLIVLC